MKERGYFEAQQFELNFKIYSAKGAYLFLFNTSERPQLVSNHN